MCSVSIMLFRINGASASIDVTAMHPGQETSCAFLISSLCNSGIPKTDFDKYPYYFLVISFGLYFLLVGLPRGSS